MPLRGAPGVTLSGNIDIRYGGSTYLITQSEVGTITLKEPAMVSVGTSQTGGGANTSGYVAINNNAVVFDAEL